MITLLLIIIYLSFISLGLPDAMLGAAWPIIRMNLALPMAGAGLVSMIISGGTIVSSVLSGRLLKRFGTAKLTIISVSMTALALLGFSFAGNYLWLCIMAVPLGLGAGAVDAALNNFVALHFSARHMSWLHCFWGVGATAGPIIMSAVIYDNGLWQKGYLYVAIIQIVLVIILFASIPLWKTYDNNQQEEEETKEKNRNVFKIPGIRLALLGFFCYCALETVVGLWGASYLVQGKNIPAGVAAGWISIYYLGITIGRFLNGVFTLRFNNKTLIRAGQFIIGLGAIILILIPYSYVSLLGLILIGLGCAPIYPSMLHETPVRFGKNNSSRLMGLQMAFAYIGTTFIPPVLGVVMGISGVKIYPIFILILLIAMFISTESVNKIVYKKIAD